MPSLARRGISLRSAALALALAAFAAAAQQQPPTPGTILDTIEPRKPGIPGAPPQLLFPADEAREPVSREGRRFQVQGFRFVGNTVFTQAELRRLVERWLDLELNLFDLNRAADRITRYYRDRGYPIARAIVPAQRVEAGLVTIEIVEGRIGRIVFEGARRYSDAFLRQRTLPLAEGLVTAEQLERSMLMLNDLPGLTALATLQPGAEFGTSDAVIKLQEKPASLVAQVNNHGRREAGQWRIDATGELNNPTGLGDALSLRVIRSEHDLLRSARIGYTIPVGAHGWRFAFAHTEVDYKVGGEFAALAIEGAARTTEAIVSYPWVRSRARNVFLSGGVRKTVTRQTALATPVVEGDLTVLTLGIAGNWVHEDSSATTAAFGFTGNFKEANVTRADRMRAKYELEGTHLTGISPRWDMFLRGLYVGGAGALPDSEKFALGGPDSVRAFRPAELRGDDGYLFQIEFRRQFAALRIPGTWSIFFDQGGVTNAGFAGKDSLRGMGAGVTLFPTRATRAKLEFAVPVNEFRPGDGKKGGRFLFNLAIAF